MRIALVVHEEKGTVFQIEDFRDVDRASQAAAELLKTKCAFGEQPLRLVDGHQRIQGIVFEEIVNFTMESGGSCFGGCVEVCKISAIFSGEIRNADFYLADRS